MFSWFQQFWNWIKSAFDGLKQSFQEFWGWIGDQFNKIWDGIAALGIWIKDFVLALFDALWSFLTDFLCWVLDTLGDLAIWALSQISINPDDWSLQGKIANLGAVVIEILHAVGLDVAIAMYVSAIFIRMTINLLSGLIPFLRA